MSFLAILRYTLKTSRDGTIPSGLAVLFTALNAICKAVSLPRSGNSLEMIWYARRTGPW